MENQNAIENLSLVDLIKKMLLAILALFGLIERHQYVGSGPEPSPVPGHAQEPNSEPDTEPEPELSQENSPELLFSPENDPEQAPALVLSLHEDLQLVVVPELDIDDDDDSDNDSPSP